MKGVHLLYQYVVFSNDSGVVFAPKKPQKLVTRSPLTVKSLGKNQYIHYLFILLDTLTGFYQGSITLT